MLCASLGVCAQLKRSESSNPSIGSCDTQPGPRALGLDGLSSRHSKGPIANASLSSEIGNRELNLLEQVRPRIGSPLKGSNNNQFGAVNPSEAQYANPTHACLDQGSSSNIQSGGQQGVRISYASAIRNSVHPQSVANSKTSIPSSPVDLDFFQPCFNNGRLIVKPPKDVVAEGCVLWGNTLVGQFMGLFPFFCDLISLPLSTIPPQQIERRLVLESALV